MNFEVGGVYRNRRGNYEVMNSSDNTMHVRYDDGSEATLSKDTQARIVANIAREEARILPSDSAAVNERFFGTLGYMAQNLIVIEGFAPERPAVGFTRVYRDLTGQELSLASSFHVHSDSTDKWGVELRVEFEKLVDTSRLEFAALPIFLVTSPRGGSARRINNNAYVRQLLAFGFVMGSQQDHRRIAERIPRSHRDAFEAGRNW